MEKLTGDSVMPFGLYKGKKMKDVPYDWLLWLYHRKRDLNNRFVWDYAKENLEAIKKQCLR